MTCLHRIFLSLFLTFLGAAIAKAQSFVVTPNDVAITATPGVNHLPIQLAVAYTPQNYDWSKITVTTDSSWVSGSIESTTGQLTLRFASADLVKRTYTATLTLVDGPRSAQVFVQATVSMLQVNRIVADHTRNRVYAIQQDGLNQGAVLVYDPIKAAFVGQVSVGKKPCDLAVSRDGNEMLVICSASKTVSVIDLANLNVRETIPLSPYGEWGVSDTSAHIAYGSGNVFYYSDGAWAPVLHVFDRTARKSIQDIVLDTSSGHGWGGIAVSTDFKSVYGWAQYGWSAGMVNSFLARYSVGADRTLTLHSKTSSTVPTTLSRDPLNTPAMMSADGKTLVIKQLAVDPLSISTVLGSTPSPIYSISPNAELLSTSTAVYNLANGNKVLDLPMASTVQAISVDYSRLVYFDDKLKALATVDLTKSLSLATIGLGRVPADQSIVLPPSQLQWSPVLGVSKYQVYLGTSAELVSKASPSSAEYLGETNTTSFSLPTTLVPGQTYYWRIDVVTANATIAGPPVRFTVSSIASDTSSVNASTVSVHNAYPVSIGLSSSTPGKPWSASADAAWISFKEASGTTPVSLQVFLDATKAPSGTSQGTIQIKGDDGSFSIPVSLTIDPLALTVAKSDAQGTKVYAISESKVTGGTARAYLLEIDMLQQKVSRVVRVGSSATDLAIHRPDNRVYVPNWNPGGLLAVNLTTFAVERTFATAPFGGVGSGEGDVYRISPGVAGRLVCEEMDQWINISLLDTTTGKVITKIGGKYQGNGQSDPSGRYYYHGEFGISSPTITKYSLIGDKLTSMGSLPASDGMYTAVQKVLVSEDGKRVFWRGTVLDADLKVLTKFDEEIHAISGDGKYAFSQKKVYEVDRLNIVASMPASIGTVLAYNSATRRIVGQKDKDAALTFMSPFGVSVLGAEMAPADGAVLSGVSQLRWTALPDVESYRVYFGTDKTPSSRPRQRQRNISEKRRQV